jgi:xanthine dehydrogenase accessory factor
MNELRHILKTAFASSEPVVMATVVKTSGTAYRRPGARLLLTQEGWLAGSISGGCLESDLVQSAWERTWHGATLLTFDTRSPEDDLWGYGMGCPGVVDVLLERWDPSDPCWQLALECLDGRRAFKLATDLSTGSHAVSSADRLVGPLELLDRDDAFAECFGPTPRLVIYGAGHDALPLATLAKQVGWFVTVSDHRPAYTARFSSADEVCSGDPLLDSQSYAVVMTHNYLRDRELLGKLLQSPVPYVGVLSSGRRVDRLLQDLGISDHPPKLSAPIGLKIGAEGPEEIALAILAEIQGVRASAASA